jgi:pimeloyl-ACP methyl ester carboxylesterase
MTANVECYSTRVPCDDGLSMAVDVYHPEESADELPTTILCHGFKGFRTWGMFPHIARRLAQTGRAVVLFDYSHNGTDTVDDEFTRLDLFEKQTVSRHVEDLGRILTAIEEDADMRGACSMDPTGIFAVGHSMGGGVAMMRAASDLRIAGLACINGVSYFDRIPEEAKAGLETDGYVSITNARTGQTMRLGSSFFKDVSSIDLEAVADEVAVPTLILQGENDNVVLPSEGVALADWIPGNVYFTVPGGDHTFGAKHPWGGWTDPLLLVVEQLDAFLPANEG